MKSMNKNKKPSMKSRLARGADRLMVRKWGNSAGIRIPTAMMRAAKLKVDDEVEATIEDGKIVVERVKSKSYALKDLLKGVTPEKCADSFESIPEVGGEVW